MSATQPLVNELVPASVRDSGRLMVVLHGLGDSMDGYRWMPSELRLPWLNYLLVNAPDDYFGGYAWYDIYGDSDAGVLRSRRLLAGLLDGLPDRGFAADNTILFGFSQGCLMSLETGLRYPGRLAGLVGISGYVQRVEELVKDLSPVARQVKVLMTHGTQDDLLPIGPVRRQVELLQQAGLDLTWREFDKAHTIAGSEELDLIRQFVSACYAQADPHPSSGEFEPRA